MLLQFVAAELRAETEWHWGIITRNGNRASVKSKPVRSRKFVRTGHINLLIQQ